MTGDVTVCSECGGKMRILEVVTDPAAIAGFLHGPRAVANLVLAGSAELHRVAPWGELDLAALAGER